jgi:hypothetical protein
VSGARNRYALERCILVTRLVQLLVPEGPRESVLEVLDREGIDYAVWAEPGRGDFEAVLSFPVPESGVETILEELEAVGVREDAYTIVLATETVSPSASTPSGSGSPASASRARN